MCPKQKSFFWLFYVILVEVKCCFFVFVFVKKVSVLLVVLEGSFLWNLVLGGSLAWYDFFSHVTHLCWCKTCLICIRIYIYVYHIQLQFTYMHIFFQWFSTKKIDVSISHQEAATESHHAGASGQSDRCSHWRTRGAFWKRWHHYWFLKWWFHTQGMKLMQCWWILVLIPGVSRCWALHQKGRGKLREMLSDVVESVLFFGWRGACSLVQEVFFWEMAWLLF